MPLKPWYNVVTPREDLRQDRPLDASEFAVHLDHVRDGRAPDVYQKPAEFFERTYLTKNLHALSTQVVRRLSGNKVETSAVFNLATQFGGGKTHALTLLYHLARGGEAAKAWKGVDSILRDAKVKSMPKTATAVFVGTEFDSIAGRGGEDGTPIRKTPWGEVAFQLGGSEALAIVAEHERREIAPGGDVIEKLLPKGQPALLLFDELMNYVSRFRKAGLATQLYDFIHNLSEVSRARDNVVLAVSVPASELEMTAEDQSDYERLKKLLDRVGKAMIMSAEAETAEIIRRRLFEWNGLPKEALNTAEAYDSWVQQNKQQLPNWFTAEAAREAFKACYPFHPSVLSVFERKWQALPRFQRTRGILRLLALWVARAYAEGYRGAHKDPLISLGTGPIEDPVFRSAMFEQLGEQRLEPAVTTDIAGKDHAHALRLDAEATAEVKKARLHRKVATTILFESNGGQHRGEATLPEIRLAVAEPDLDIGNVEQCLEALADSCYFLMAERNRYRFSFQPNLNKLLADRRASIRPQDIDERVRAEIQTVFTPTRGQNQAQGISLDLRTFPRRTVDVPDRPMMTLVVLSPEQAASDASTRTFMTTLVNECGASSRSFKSGLVLCVCEDSAQLSEGARRLLAWQAIDEEKHELKLDETQRQKLIENIRNAERDLKEAVWRGYKNLYLLGPDGALQHHDLGLVHSSAAATLVELILGRLRDADIVSDGVSPNFLVRNWPPALREWSTKAVRDMFYASPKYPRLLKPETVKDTISRGLDGKLLAYVGKTDSGGYEPFVYQRSLSASEIEVADDVFIVTRERAEEYLAQRANAAAAPSVGGTGQAGASGSTGLPTTQTVGSGQAGATTPSGGASASTERLAPGATSASSAAPEHIKSFRWSGEVSAQNWMKFYTKVLTRFATSGGMRLSLTVDVAPPAGLNQSQLEETRQALRELGLSDNLVLNPKDH